MKNQTFRLTLILVSLSVFCISLFGTTAPASARPQSEDLMEQVDAYILETMNRLPIPGLAVGIVKGDEVLYLHGYGTANTNGDPVTPQTPFMLASVTKTFTALAIHQLANAGKLDLDAPIQTYIPEFHLADEEASTSITVRDLLDHTSGITTAEGTEPYLHSPKSTFESALNKLAHFNPKYQPGEQYEYSNWNYVLLGELVARTSDQPYAEYVQKNILDPLEMTHASFADYHTIPGVATGNLIAFGFSMPFDEPHVPLMLSAGYLTASAEDMTHYLTLYFNHGQYNGHSLLPAKGRGWYDVIWNWHTGTPNDINYSFSGGHNSINTNIQLFSRHDIGVVVLMNTRLDEILPAPAANDISFNIARIVINYPYELPSNRGFYMNFAILDGFLLLMSASILWQALGLKKWISRYHASHSKRIIPWLGITFDILLCIVILIFPTLFGSRWNIMLHFRAEVALPLLVIGISLGTLGLIKAVQTRS